MSDVVIDEVTTRIEVTDRAPELHDMRKLVALVMEHLRQERLQDSMRNEDGRMRDRSWLSDVKPE